MFPLRISSNHRYLEDKNGVPFPILGDAAWELPHNTDSTGLTTYFDSRIGLGFNSILVEAIEHKFTYQKPPKDLSGNLPFTKTLGGGTFTGSPNGCPNVNGAGSWRAGTNPSFLGDPYSDINSQAPDFTTPNAAYWTQLDAFVALCAQKGVAVFMFPAYVGYAGQDEGWMQEMVANDAVMDAGSKSKLWNYGAWLANHFKDATNIIWVLGGDFGIGSGGSFNTAQSAAVMNLLNGMKSVTGQKSSLWTSHWGRGSFSTDLSQFASSIDIQGAYVGTSVSSAMRSAYNRSPAQPVFELEDYYEGSSSLSGPMRRYHWWAFLDGIAGQFYGAEPLWPFADGWQSSLNLPGALDQGVLNKFIKSIAWQTLVPSGLAGQKVIVTANNGSPDASDYIACAGEIAGTRAVCYVPPGWSKASFSIDATVMAGSFHATWIDPTTGVPKTPSSSIPAAGTYVAAPPSGTHSDGARDWVLLLETGN